MVDVGVYSIDKLNIIAGITPSFRLTVPALTGVAVGTVIGLVSETEVSAAAVGALVLKSLAKTSSHAFVPYIL